MRVEKLPGRNWGKSFRATGGKSEIPHSEPNPREAAPAAGGDAVAVAVRSDARSGLCESQSSARSSADAALQNFCRGSVFQGKQRQVRTDVTQPCSEGWPGLGLTPHGLHCQLTSPAGAHGSPMARHNPLPKQCV